MSDQLVGIVLVLIGKFRVLALPVEHFLESRIRQIALGASSFETHPEFKTFDMAQVPAVRKLLNTIALLIVSETDKASDDSMVNKRLSVGYHAHFNEILGMHALLNHVVDSIFAECFHGGLASLDLLLDIC